ncbi:MAG: reprolysin-like metallopeptidase [Phycisphaerales bacterium]
MSAGFCASSLAAPGANGPAKSDKVGIYEPWEVLQARLPDNVLGEKAFVRPIGGRQVILDMAKIKTQLAGAPLEDANQAVGIMAAPIVIALPKPDGTFERFEVEEYSMMEPALAAQFPNFKTYKGTSIDGPHGQVRIDVTDLGFRAQVLDIDGSYWIDPVTMGDTNLYTSYYKGDLGAPQAWTCHFDELPENHVAVDDDNPFGDRVATGTTRRDFRTAIAATGEYTAFFGGTVPLGFSAITSLVNRISGVYENDFSVRLVLVANETSIIYTNSATDPYTNTVTSAQLTTNTSNINTVIGSTNYDVGHLVTTDPGGGLAGLGVICGSSKGSGATGLSSPTGDAFAIDYVAHELGHEFGGNHTFNGSGGSCAGGNRNAATSVEPGSGITIMAYAGICGGDDLALHSVAFFHARSIQEITAKVAAVSCYSAVVTGNTIPVAIAPAAISIPIQTPYALTGSGTDADGDTLTFCWEQNITSTAAQSAGLSGIFPDIGTNAYQRSFDPISSPTRTFPQLANLLANNFTKGEQLPNTSRSIPYRLTVRDGRGGMNFADVNITSTTTSGPFLVTAPNTAVSWAGLSSQTVTWNVANTTAAPVNCANVDILLSTDGGNTFPTVLATGVPNSGSASVVVPNSASTTARIKVKASANIFFDISNVNFTITAATVPSNPTNAQASPSSVCSGGTVTLSVNAPPGGVVIDWYSGSCGGTFVSTGTSINVNPVAATSYFAKARRTSDNVTSAGCASTSVSILASPVDPTGASSDVDNLCQFDSGNVVLTATGGSGTTLRWFTGSCAGTQIGTGNGLSIASPAVTTTYYARWETSCGVSNCASVTVTVRVCPADFNCDQTVDDSDFVVFANSYDVFDCSDGAMLQNCAADINGDGFVDDADFVQFASAYDAFVCP